MSRRRMFCAVRVEASIDSEKFTRTLREVGRRMAVPGGSMLRNVGAVVSGMRLKVRRLERAVLPPLSVARIWAVMVETAGAILGRLNLKSNGSESAVAMIFPLTSR